MIQIQQFSTWFSNGFFITGDKTILMDTGFVKSPEDFAGHAAKAGIDPKDIDLIIVSHEHPDHYMQLDTIRDLCGAKVLCHKAAARPLETGTIPPATVRPVVVPDDAFDADDKPPLPPLPIVKPDIVIDSEEYDLNPWGVDAKLVYTPGHSWGSYSLFAGDVAIIGDIIIADNNGNPITARFADDETVLKNSVMKILNSGAKTLYSGHLPPVPVEVLRELYEKEWRQMGI